MAVSVEARIVDRLAARFRALRDSSRCEFAQEVRLLSWGHIIDGQPHTMRADFVCSWDFGPLIAVEVKGRMQAPVELGKALSQSSDYARAVIGANAADRIPQGWVGKPIWAAALAFDDLGSHWKVQEALVHAHRLYGPRNVGFLVTGYGGLHFSLGGERYWSQAAAWRADAFARGLRVGSARKDAP